MNSCEWYTPKWIFEKLGIEFDMDVCSPPNGEGTHVPAKQYLSIDDDGLKTPWVGMVWCNPPFSTCKPWIEKFINHGQGVALCPVSKTRWFDKVVANNNIDIEILPSTLKFIKDGKECTVRSPCCLLHFK